MSLPRLWLFLAVALPVLASVLAPMSTVDLTYHLRAGEEILATGAIPTVDTWTFTAAGQPWFDQQWGAQVTLAVAERLGSWTGLVLFRALLTGVIFACLLTIARRRGLDARTAALLTIGVFLVAAPAMALRPQLLGMASFAVVLLLVVDRRTDPRLVWLVPLVVAVWANLHGSFFLGPMVVVLAWLEDVHDRVQSPHRTLAIGLVGGLAACLTPFGPWVWTYALGLSANPDVTARITEWQPTSVRDAAGLVFFASAAVVAALIGRRGRATPWPTLAWLAVFFLVGIYAQRGIAWWPLAAVAAIAGVLIPAAADPEETPAPTMRRLNTVIAGALILVGVALLPAWRPVDQGTGAPIAVISEAPSGITAALREMAEPGDRVLNPQPWGSWFEYALPDLTYAIDSRIEFFPPSVWDEYSAITTGADGWERLLLAWSVDVLVVDADNAGLEERALRDGWVRVYDDQDGTILVPRPGGQAGP